MPSLLRATDLAGAEKESLEQTERVRWRRYDSLADPSKATELVQVRMGTFIDPEFQMPQEASFESQEQGSLACGFFMLTWMEQELRLQRGVWLRTCPVLMKHGETAEGLEPLKKEQTSEQRASSS